MCRIIVARSHRRTADIDVVDPEFNEIASPEITIDGEFDMATRSAATPLFKELVIITDSPGTGIPRRYGERLKSTRQSRH